MLLPAIVHGARPLLAWSLVLRSNSIAISFWVSLNPVRTPITHDAVSEPPTTTALTMDTQSKMRQRGARPCAIPTELAFIPSRKPVGLDTNDPAELYTYAATSTISGASRVLFSRLRIEPDSHIDDGKCINSSRLLIFSVTCWTQTQASRRRT